MSGDCIDGFRESLCGEDGLTRGIWNADFEVRSFLALIPDYQGKYFDPEVGSYEIGLSLSHKIERRTIQYILIILAKRTGNNEHKNPRSN